MALEVKCMATHATHFSLTDRENKPVFFNTTNSCALP